MARDIKQLHPTLQNKIEQLKNMCLQKGLNIGIGECLRTVEEQDALYAKGRTTGGSIVTNAKGSSYNSQHQWGIAFDFFKNVKGSEYSDSDFFEDVAKIAKSIGLGWGGDWKSFKDRPHLYLPDWGSTTKQLKDKYGKPDNFKNTWHSENKNKENVTGYKYSVGQFVVVSTHYAGKNDPNEKAVGLNPHLNMKVVALHFGARNPYQTDFGTFVNDGDIRGIASKSSLAEIQAKEASMNHSGVTELPTSAPIYKVGNTYTLLADGLRVRTKPNGNVKGYNQLTSSAQKSAYSNGTLKKGTRVTCKDLKTEGSSIWMKTPSGWIAAVASGKVYVS